MPVQVIGALEAATLSEVVERRGKSHSFLTALLYPPATHRVIGTSTVQVDEKTYNPSMAPFVRTTDEAVMIPRSTGSSYSVTCPNIALKAPLQASDELLNRRAGSNTILIHEGENADIIANNVEQLIVDDTMVLLDQVEEREEWMVAQGLIGSPWRSRLVTLLPQLSSGMRPTRCRTRISRPSRRCRATTTARGSQTPSVVSRLRRQSVR